MSRIVAWPVPSCVSSKAILKLSIPSSPLDFKYLIRVSMMVTLCTSLTLISVNFSISSSVRDPLALSDNRISSTFKYLLISLMFRSSGWPEIQEKSNRFHKNEKKSCKIAITSYRLNLFTTLNVKVNPCMHGNVSDLVHAGFWPYMFVLCSSIHCCM